LRYIRTFLCLVIASPCPQSQNTVAHFITSSLRHFQRLWRSKVIKTKWAFCNIMCRWLGLDSEENVPEACKECIQCSLSWNRTEAYLGSKLNMYFITTYFKFSTYAI
jgi:hypothetical protein